MATPEDRLTAVEDAVQELRFVHMVKTDATTTGLGMLYAHVQRVEHALGGFRAEVAAEFGAVRDEIQSLGTDMAVELATVKGDLGTVRNEQARQGVKLDEVQATLAEVLRRLPEPGAS